jgi:hypothetical protein
VTIPAAPIKPHVDVPPIIRRVPLNKPWLALPEVQA